MPVCRIESKHYLPGVFIESTAELAASLDWVVPLALLRSMAEGKPLSIEEPIARLLAQRLPTLQDIYTAWIPGFTRVRTLLITAERHPSPGVSLFFSGGVDSLYSVLAHREEIDNLILIHGFDVPLAEVDTFGPVEKQAREVARFFGKRLIVVRTNLHWEQKPNLPCGWDMYHGAALAAIAHGLAPQHSKVYIASTHPLANLHPWGSHPLLDPLWSSEAVQIVHDHCEERVEKLRRLLKEEPEALARVRVCWEMGNHNCGRCEKCLRTMIALRGLGMEGCSAFPNAPDPKLVRQEPLPHNALVYWRELTRLDLPPELAAAVRSAIRSAESGLPPHAGTLRREVKRSIHAGRQIAGILRSLVSS